ncbi:dihydrofolate reductase family protein [Gordonia polyisoprenivorans]|uniref:dihydrofolate reductase family protein n=1 Tax=Gordonia polyisoprenivorans TaxID=84595 RepID=UPI0002F6B0DD|nr:dihydrofolate reductase family protein [Gordonia polyisoprenivorans]
MSTLVLKMSMSLDGYIAGPDGEMDWAMAARSDDSTAWVLRTLQEADVHLIGRGFHDGVAAFWSSAQGPMAAAMNDTRRSSRRTPCRQKRHRHRAVFRSRERARGNRPTSPTATSSPTSNV